VQPVRKPASVPRRRKEVAEAKGEEKKEAVCTEMPTKPEPLVRPEIEYTTAARAAGIEGRLVLRLIVAADGGVGQAEVLRGVDPGLDAAAVATVERWRFRPSQACGKPVAGGTYTLARRFELGD
jgi:TonB family protein